MHLVLQQNGGTTVYLSTGVTWLLLIGAGFSFLRIVWWAFRELVPGDLGRPVENAISRFRSRHRGSRRNHSEE